MVQHSTHILPSILSGGSHAEQFGPESIGARTIPFEKILNTLAIRTLYYWSIVLARNLMVPAQAQLEKYCTCPPAVI